MYRNAASVTPSMGERPMMGFGRCRQKCIQLSLAGGRKGIKKSLAPRRDILESRQRGACGQPASSLNPTHFLLDYFIPESRVGRYIQTFSLKRRDIEVAWSNRSIR